MKKNFILAALFLFTLSAAAYADGMVFDPTEYPTINEIPVSKVNSSPTAGSAAKLPSNIKISSEIQSNSNLAQDAVSEQSGNFNNALFELDSAQVNIRNQLLDYKAKYQEVDTQYQLIKEQRKVLAKQIKDVEKRIKNIEKTKSNIRKTMI